MEPKTRTSVNLTVSAFTWQKKNIRNLSVFLEKCIADEKLQRQYDERPVELICECGAKFMTTMLVKTGGKCPECKAIIWRGV